MFIYEAFTDKVVCVIIAPSVKKARYVLGDKTNRLTIHKLGVVTADVKESERIVAVTEK